MKFLELQLVFCLQRLEDSPSHDNLNRENAREKRNILSKSRDNPITSQLASFFIFSVLGCRDDVGIRHGYVHGLQLYVPWICYKLLGNNGAQDRQITTSHLDTGVWVYIYIYIYMYDHMHIV